MARRMSPIMFDATATLVRAPGRAPGGLRLELRTDDVRDMAVQVGSRLVVTDANGTRTSVTLERRRDGSYYAPLTVALVGDQVQVRRPW